MKPVLTAAQRNAISLDPRRPRVIADEYGVTSVWVWKIQKFSRNAVELDRQRAAAADLLKRQVTFGVCGGMRNPQIAAALDISLYAVEKMVHLLLDETGMSNRFEFAIQQNAAVREQYWDWMDALKAA